MRIGIILETNESEKAWNGIRFANTALKQEQGPKPGGIRSVPIIDDGRLREDAGMGRQGDYILIARKMTDLRSARLHPMTRIAKPRAT